MKRIAINGMGRIGRTSLKLIFETPNLEVIAVNDIASIENIAYLLKHDSVHGSFEKDISIEGYQLIIDGKKIAFLSERDPEQLPWEKLKIDIVIESTGVFTRQEDADKHITAGAKTVVLSGPSKSRNIPTVVHGVNTQDGNTSIFSCASCTTNNISPVMEIIGRRIGIKKAIMTTIHADTASNRTIDSTNEKDFRMGRSGLNNLIPTSTGAAIATTLGSLSDITIVTDRKTSAEEINQILAEEAGTDRYLKVFAVTNEPIVSSDIIKSPYAAIADLEMTKVVDGDLVKILAWYDNEWGFTSQMIRQIQVV
jgi:glyceraldehyde 3-phosphate dehydrogenase